MFTALLLKHSRFMFYLSEGHWIWTALILRQLKSTLSSSTTISSSHRLEELLQVIPVSSCKLSSHAHIKKHNMGLGSEKSSP